MERGFHRVNIAVVAVADVRADTLELVVERLTTAGHAVVAREVVDGAAPSLQRLRAQFLTWIADPLVDVVIAVGGIDSTAVPDALEPLITRPLPGFADLFRLIAYEEIGTAAMLIHPLAAQCKSTFVFCLPPSTGAARIALDKILVPQLDTRTRPRNLALQLPRIQAALEPGFETTTPLPARPAPAAAVPVPRAFVETQKLQTVAAPPPAAVPPAQAKPPVWITPRPLGDPPPKPATPPTGVVVLKQVAGTPRPRTAPAVPPPVPPPVPVRAARPVPAPASPEPAAASPEPTPLSALIATLPTPAPRPATEPPAVVMPTTPSFAPAPYTTERYSEPPRRRRMRSGRLLWIVAVFALAAAVGAALMIAIAGRRHDAIAASQPAGEPAPRPTVPAPRAAEPTPAEAPPAAPPPSTAPPPPTAEARTTTPRPSRPSPTPPPAEAPVAEAAPVDDGCDEVSCVLDRYARACCERYRPAPPPPASPPGPPESLDKPMVKAGIEPMKPRVIQCGEHSPAKGTVKIRVHVTPAGQIDDTSVAATPDPALGACVAAAIGKATFPVTQRGATFVYPFVF